MSQCSTILPLATRNMSNDVVVYVLPSLSLASRTSASVTRSRSAVIEISRSMESFGGVAVRPRRSEIGLDALETRFRVRIVLVVFRRQVLVRGVDVAALQERPATCPRRASCWPPAAGRCRSILRCSFG